MEYADTLGGPNGQGRYRFSASSKPPKTAAPGSAWHRRTAAQLPRRIMGRLVELDDVR